MIADRENLIETLIAAPFFEELLSVKCDESTQEELIRAKIKRRLKIFEVNQQKQRELEGKLEELEKRLKGWEKTLENTVDHRDYNVFLEFIQQRNTKVSGRYMEVLYNRSTGKN